MSPVLSICIATYNRGAFIGETLDSILQQMQPGIELIVVDGASPDDTQQVMEGYVQRHPFIRYFREKENSGVDKDFDKAVGYACGTYCWLMTDDDLLKPGAVARVLSELNGGYDLVILNTEIRNVDLSAVFEERRLRINEDRSYGAGERDAMFMDLGGHLSFIGCVVIRRLTWLSRDRSPYYGSLFIHVGVIFQSPALECIKALAEPLIVVRYGNAMWTPRSFEIWLFKWPQLIWSFGDFSDAAKRKICRQQPWRSAKALFHNRALGAYSVNEFRRFWPRETGWMERAVAGAIGVFPASWANAVMVLYFSTLARPAPMAVHDLLFSRHAGRLSHLVARLTGAEAR